MQNAPEHGGKDIAPAIVEGIAPSADFRDFGRT